MGVPADGEADVGEDDAGVARSGDASGYDGGVVVGRWPGEVDAGDSASSSGAGGSG